MIIIYTIPSMLGIQLRFIVFRNTKTLRCNIHFKIGLDHIYMYKHAASFKQELVKKINDDCVSEIKMYIVLPNWMSSSLLSTSLSISGTIDIFPSP